MAKDIYDVLHQEHKEARKILDTLVSTAMSDAHERREKGHKVAIELITHHEAESKVLYQRLLDFDAVRDHVKEHQQEHEQANSELREFLQIDPADPVWLDKLEKIKQAVDHHVEDEENELFPQVKNLLDKEEAKRMADEFRREQGQRKERLKAA